MFVLFVVRKMTNEVGEELIEQQQSVGETEGSAPNADDTPWGVCRG
jgi:hypothetical protein